MNLGRRLAHRKIEGRVFVMDPGSSRLHSMNETGSFIWERLTAGSGDAEIARALSAEFEVSEENGLRDVREFVAALRSEGLLEDAR